MDTVTIRPNMLRGEVTPPPSKSVAHRAIIASALTGKQCKVHNIALSADISATLQCMERLGACFKYNEKTQTVSFSAKRKQPAAPLILDCCESGSTLRFLIPLALCFADKVTFIGQGRLMERPQKPYFDLFDERGITYTAQDGKLTVEGSLQAGHFTLPGDVSSQFVTGLLFALPLLKGDSVIEITTPLESKGYIDLTLDVLKAYGIQIKNQNYKKFHIAGGQTYTGSDYTVESDFSQAAFFLVAGALGCDIICNNLRRESLQGDKKILDILKEVQADLEETNSGGIRARRTAHMRGTVIDASEIPDLVPILTVLCSFCQGESHIINAGRLRIKESDRLAAITAELNRMGAQIEEHSDSLTIHGVSNLHGATLSSWNDHRIAMAAAIAACRAEGDVSIMGAEAVRKSYPEFFDVYRALSTEK